MQIQHSSDTCKMLGELHGGAALSECQLATCQSYLEINRYLILEKNHLEMSQSWSEMKYFMFSNLLYHSPTLFERQCFFQYNFNSICKSKHMHIV